MSPGGSAARGYSWVVFDADGTLFDYEAAEAWALSTTFAELKLPFRDQLAELYRRINVEIWSERDQGLITAAGLRVERFARLFAAGGVDGDPAVFSPLYLANLARGAQLIDGAERAVKQLHRSGRVRLALATNGLHDVQRPRLEASVLAGCFDAVVISDEIGVAKPDAAFFDAACGLMGGPRPGAVLMVGDSLAADIAGAGTYGWATCWFAPGGGLPGDARQGGGPPDAGVRPDFVIRELDELGDIVLRAAGPR